MKKILELWKNNKITIVLVVILIICIIAICIVAMTYFFGGSDSVYGDRLSDISGNEISDKKVEAYEKTFDDNELVTDVEAHVKGKIIYVNIDFVDNISIVEAQSVATASLENIEEEYKEIYDINFVLKTDESESSDGFTILGAKNAIVDTVSWVNNTPLPVEEGE